MAHDVFVSYSAADKSTAEAAVAGLEGHGISCWIAPRDIPAGSEYGEQIVEALKNCRIVLLIFSASANSSPHVRREVERAISSTKVIIPFRIEPIAPTGAMEFLTCYTVALRSSWCAGRALYEACRASLDQTSSKMVAFDWPPPSHIVCRPYRMPLSRMWCSSVVVSRAPEAPSG